MKVSEHCLLCVTPLNTPTEKLIGSCQKCAPLKRQRNYNKSLTLLCEAINS